MKKFALIALSAMLVCILAVSSFAATAFTQIPVEEAEIIDDDTTQDLGGNGTFCSVVDGYGVGNSSKNDIVKYAGVDFGANGAKAMTLFFGYGRDDGSETTLSVFIDDPNSEAVAKYSIGFTGGWDIANAKEIVADCAIPAGTHDVYIQFTNECSGSFSWVSFTEADPAPETEAETEAPVVAPAAQTFDGVIVAAVAIIAAGAAVVTRKK